ncbi:MAG: hypothetical protein KU37_07225 [Sulfuricurvum sp. PC08-66]|nr:MAG: hypothetical protein KU37_07225 [Sulfuricurvum sp. PC08-66]
MLKFFLTLLVMFSFIFFLGCQSEGESVEAQIKVTFHDNPLVGNEIQSINMKVVETQIVDMNDTIITISNKPLSFNLLELTANNPVALAHTSLKAGIYKQIRLILDQNTTILLSDGNRYSMKVPSGEQSGIKIDGIFEIPAGRLYTLDIDLDPAKSVHYTKGSGFIMKPVIKITGSDINSGNFFFSSSSNNDEIVFQLNSNGSMQALTSQYPKYVMTGNFYHDGINKRLTLSPTAISCPSCNIFEQYYIGSFIDIPDSMIYDITSFGVDAISLSDAITGNKMDLYRVSSFTLNNPPIIQNVAFKILNLNQNWTGKTIYAQLIPSDYIGKMFSTVTTIEDINNTTVQFEIHKDLKLLTDSYIFVTGIIDNTSSLVIDNTTQSITFDYGVLVAKNNANPIRFNLNWDLTYASPINMDVNFTIIKE